MSIKGQRVMLIRERSHLAHYPQTMLESNTSGRSTENFSGSRYASVDDGWRLGNGHRVHVSCISIQSSSEGS